MWNTKCTRALLLFVLLDYVGLNGVNGWPLSMETLLEGEQVAIDQLRALMENELPEEYMEEDVYLVKWLSATDFNVEEAAQLLRDNLKWRKEHKMDTILEERWLELEDEFPYERETMDMQGRPVLYFYFGQWNIHKLITEEDSLVTLGRYMMKMIEESDRHVRKLRKAKGEGSQSPIQFTLIINFDGYSIWNQGCFQCLAFYRGFGQTLESHFPRSVERVVLINVPTAFEVIFWYIEAVLAEKTRESVKLYGPNRKVWEPAILSYIKRDQVPGDLLELSLTQEGDEYITTRKTQNNTL